MPSWIKERETHELDFLDPKENEAIPLTSQETINVNSDEDNSETEEPPDNISDDEYIEEEAAVNYSLIATRGVIRCILTKLRPCLFLSY